MSAPPYSFIRLQAPSTSTKSYNGLLPSIKDTELGILQCDKSEIQVPKSSFFVMGEDSMPERSSSRHSHSSDNSRLSRKSHHSSISRHSAESTPLLSRDVDNRSYGDRTNNYDQPSATSLSINSFPDGSPDKKRRKWPIIIAITLLTLIFVTILGLGFAAPAVIEEYAKEAVEFEPTEISIDSITTSGVTARMQGEFTLDASKVRKKPVRDLGRFGTWVARAVEVTDTVVHVYIPEYGNVLLGTADVPPIVLDIRNGHTTHVDVLTELVVGNIDGIRGIAGDWLDGRLGQLRVSAVAQTRIRTGLWRLGTKRITESLVFKGQDFPTIPRYNIKRLNFHEIELPNAGKGMAADVSLKVKNHYPLTFTVPSLSFDILVQNCEPDLPSVNIANATTKAIDVESKQDVKVDVAGIIRKLPESLTTACPNTDKTPLDLLLGGYIRGNETTIYVRGSDNQPSGTPEWISSLLKGVTVPVPFAGKTFDNLIREFSLANVHFKLPSFFAEPGSPESRPSLSAVVKAVVNLPEEMNFPVEVDKVRADAIVYYHGKKLGTLDLHKWQTANSTRIEAENDKPAGLAVDSIVENAPLNITEDDVFAEVVQALLFGTEKVLLGVKAKVDVETNSALGRLVVRDIPANGKFYAKPLSGHNFTNYDIKVGSLEITETTKSTFSLEAKINFTNPTEYSARVPYVDILLLNNGSVLGHATARDVSVKSGPNYNIPVTSLWDPVGPGGAAVGRELLSQYISGYNTNLTIQTHAGTIPSIPRLGEALSSLHIEIPTPKIRPPRNPNHRHDGDDDDDNPDDDPDDPNSPNNTPPPPHFIDDATMHLLTSTCTLTLLSPLPHSTLLITHLNATALHNASLIGSIIYDLPFAVPPGASTSPHLPVSWSLGSVGYDALRQALGGKLKVDARAEVGIQVGRWVQEVWFEGRGVGARVRI